MQPLTRTPKDSRAAAAEPWWTSAVVYQIWPRSFADADGDGHGDLAGIRSRLDYLDALGVDVLWLSPIYPSPQADAGYDISDFQGIDPAFGTLDDFDGLLADAHERGMRVILDVVFNHTSDEHPWFVESRSSRDNPKRDWYWWRPARDGVPAGEPGAEPNNWGSLFTGSAWQLDAVTGEYYLHFFSAKQPDLNWENPEVRAAIHSMLRWWLDRGVDGFRLDVLNLLSKDPSLPDGQIPDGERFGSALPFLISGPRIHEFVQELHQQVVAGRAERLLLVGETPGATLEEAELFTDPTRAEVNMVFQFEHLQLDRGEGWFDLEPLKLTALKASLGRWQDGLADTGWNSLYWNNHDQPRAVSRFGDPGEHRARSAKLLATVLHLHRGTPYIFQGEELGMTNPPLVTIDDFRDIWSLNHYADRIEAGAAEDDTLAALRGAARDNARSPMQWDGGEHAGFTTGTPWMAVNPNSTAINAHDQEADEHSVLHHYRKLIALRHREPAIASGDFRMLLAGHEQLYAFTRRHGDTELLVLANFSGAPTTIQVPDAAHWRHSELLLSNVSTSQAVSTALTLEPWEARIHRRTTTKA